jgi:hypothetical protein
MGEQMNWCEWNNLISLNDLPHDPLCDIDCGMPATMKVAQHWYCDYHGEIVEHQIANNLLGGPTKTVKEILDVNKL